MNIAQPWTVDEKFDFIHSRLLFSVQLDVAELARQVFAHLKPGGWWEAFELRFPPTSPDGTGARSQMERWIQVTLEATTALGQNWTIWEPLADYMRNAGFVDVQEQRRILELGAWGRDPSPNDPGTMYETEVMGRFARMWHLLLGKGLGWKKEDIDQLAEDRHREAMEGKVHYIIECVIMTGRRPE